MPAQLRSYSVEASADLGLLVPSLRVERFHQALYESMSLADKAVTAGRMLQRLGSAIRAELTAIESIESRADENRDSAATPATNQPPRQGHDGPWQPMTPVITGTSRSSTTSRSTG